MDWIFALTLNNFVFCLFSGVIERHESRLDYKINYFPEQFLSRYLSVVEFLMILIYISYYYFFARCASDKIGRLIASEGYFYFLLLLLQKCNLYINKKSIYNAGDSFENPRSRQMQCLPLNKYLLLMLFFKGNKISRPNKKQPTFSSCFVFQQGILQTCKHLLCLDFLSKIF